MKFGTIASKKILKEKECFGLQWKIRFIPDTENDGGKVPSLHVLRHGASGEAENSEVTTVNCPVGIYRFSCQLVVVSKRMHWLVLVSEEQRPVVGFGVSDTILGFHVSFSPSHTH